MNKPQFPKGKQAFDLLNKLLLAHNLGAGMQLTASDVQVFIHLTSITRGDLQQWHDEINDWKWPAALDPVKPAWWDEEAVHGTFAAERKLVLCMAWINAIELTLAHTKKEDENPPITHPAGP